MRLILSEANEKVATGFSQLFLEKKIEHLLEKQGGQFYLWVVNEDQISDARKLIDQYKETPEALPKPRAPQPTLPSPEPQPSSPPKAKRITFKSSHLGRAQMAPRFGKLTLILIILCSFLTFFGDLPVQESSPQGPKETSLFSMLMYEQPNGWGGYYDYMLAKITHPSADIQLPTPPFSALKAGEWWRLFTPCLLHAGLLHLFFNMLWLIMLGNQIEWHLGKWRYLFLVLAIGVFSNTAQYLFTGASFVGFSGVVSGLFGFIWFRQKFYPWEGYLLSPGTAIFLFIFLFGMLFIEVLSFFSIILHTYQLLPFTIPSSGIANAAHIAGLLIGGFCAKFNLFKQKLP